MWSLTTKVITMSFLQLFYDLDFLIMAVIGIIALLYAVDRMFTKVPVIGTGPEDDTESRVIRVLSIGAAVLSIATPVIFAIERVFLENEAVRFHWLTILLFTIAAVMLLAKPLRDLPGTAIVTVLIGVVLMVLVVFWVASSDELSIFGIKLPLWLPFVLVFVVLLLVFIVVYIIEKQIDALLDIIAWSPFLLVVAVMLLIQAVLMLLHPHQGIQAFIS